MRTVAISEQCKVFAIISLFGIKWYLIKVLKNDCKVWFFYLSFVSFGDRKIKGLKI